MTGAPLNAEVQSGQVWKDHTGRRLRLLDLLQPFPRWWRAEWVGEDGEREPGTGAFEISEWLVVQGELVGGA